MLEYVYLKMCWNDGQNSQIVQTGEKEVGTKLNWLLERFCAGNIRQDEEYLKIATLNDDIKKIKIWINFFI